MDFPNHNYAGISDKYADIKTAKVVLIPVPYDGTSTWGKGADKGPEAFLQASVNMELYDIETDSEVYKKGIHLAKAVSEKRSPELMCEAVEKNVTEYLDQKKFVTLFGGEHSVSIGAIRAFRKKYENLTVLQFDAHADLRPEYEGSACNHACALHEASQTTNLVQIGIRSMDVSEKPFLNRENCFFARDLSTDSDWQKKALEKICDPVYITIDLDVFDSAIMPSTGTPEPGGMDWYGLMSFLTKVIRERKVVGFNITELSPSEHNKAPNFLAAKLYYRILSEKFSHENRRI